MWAVARTLVVVVKLGFSAGWFVSNRRKAVLLVAVLIVASVLSVYAYLSSLAPQRGPRVTITSPPLEFSMELDKMDFRSGENVTVRISLKNIGNDTITLWWSEYYLYDDVRKYFDFYVLDPYNTLVYQWTREHFALAAVLEETLNPGGQFTSTYPWHQRTGYPDEVLVPAGEYTVKGSTRQLRLTAKAQTSVITLETPAITFTIK